MNIRRSTPRAASSPMAALLISAVIAGCGGGEGSAPTPSPSAPATGIGVKDPAACRAVSATEICTDVLAAVVNLDASSETLAYIGRTGSDGSETAAPSLPPVTVNKTSHGFDINSDGSNMVSVRWTGSAYDLGQVTVNGQEASFTGENRLVEGGSVPYKESAVSFVTKTLGGFQVAGGSGAVSAGQPPKYQWVCLAVAPLTFVVHGVCYAIDLATFDSQEVVVTSVNLYTQTTDRWSSTN